MAHDLQQIHDFLVDIAHKAGHMITKATPSTSESGSKKNSADLVTETDQAVEKMVSTALLERYPDFKFMGEETYKPGTLLTADPTFIVDPIDGTTNFVHAFPSVCISLGFTVNHEPVVGVVLNPFTNTLYSAIQGRGAFLNHNTPLPLKGSANGRALEPLTSLSGALVAIEWGSDRAGNDFDVKVETFRKLAASKEQGGAMVHGLRSLGSAAMNLCAVADGSIDMYMEGGSWAWDFCAGMVIVKEAGGMLVDANPGNWNIRVDDRRILACRNGVEKKVIEEFWTCVVGKISYTRG